MQTPDQFYTALAQDPRFGARCASAMHRVFSHAAFTRHLYFVPFREHRAVHDALTPLKEQLRGGPIQFLGRAVEGALSGLVSLLPLRRVLPSERFARAATNAPGLLRSSLGLVQAAERLDRGIALPFAPSEVRSLVFLIGVGQRALAVIGDGEAALEDLVAVWETELLGTMREHLPFLTALAASSEEMAAALADTQQYLTGPAAESVARRRENQRTLAALTSKAATAAQAQVESEAYKAITARLKQAVDQAAKAPPPPGAPGGERR